MTANEKAALINARAAAALAEILGMMSDNMQRAFLGQAMAYPESAFLEVVEECGIGHNAIMDVLRGR